MSGEDLANVGPVALLNDLAVMSVLGVEDVERNGHPRGRSGKLLLAMGWTSLPGCWTSSEMTGYPRWIEDTWPLWPGGIRKSP